MRPQATFSFFIFLQLFHFFTRRSFPLVAPSSSPLFPPCPSFLLVTPSSSSLLSPFPFFLLVPALSRSLRICKRLFFINFDESITDGPTDASKNDFKRDRRVSDASLTTRPFVRFPPPPILDETQLPSSTSPSSRKTR